MKLWIKIAAVATVVLFGSAGGYVYYLYASVKSTAENIYEPLKPDPAAFRSTDPEVNQRLTQQGDQQNSSGQHDLQERQEQKREQQPAETAVVKRKPFSVLVMGVDQRENDSGRSDALLLFAVNPNKKSILLFNIPRDTRTEIVGHGTVDKINHAYAFGGVNMSVRTVEKFLDYPIDYYVKVNMEGFANIIDILGGVEVENEFSFDYEGFSFPKGALELDGTKALAYSRMRFDDPRGDLGRNTRQRQIIQAVLKSALKVSSIAEIPKILNEVNDHMKTNFTYDEMKELVTGYRPEIEKIDVTEVQGSGARINNIYYYIVSAAERQRIHDAIKDQLAE